MSKPGFAKLLAPSLTVFISSACIMIIELVASRLIARHLGSSLYTWTSVIGVVLAGITIGNYIGGRIADKFQARKTLACLFGLASVACVIIIVLNNFVGNWVWLWHLNWPTRVFLHIAIVFLLPSTILGTISPVVAKMALDQGQATGKTVGTIYAWGAAGSIAGTFLAGFYLIATMGTINIIWTISISLLVLAILYWAKFWFFYAWAAALAFFLFLGFSSNASAQTTGTMLGLREKADPSIIYQDETQYCYVAVKQISETPDRRLFIQDKLKHSEVLMDDPYNLQYFYTHIYASITHGLRPSQTPQKFLVIGGGGYVYPRYLEKNWPGSHIDVAEIDPGVTKAANSAFGLPDDTTINSISLDARNYVDELLEKKRQGEIIALYDFIYEDAINDYTVPFQLVTQEFNEKILKILKEDGVYMVNLIEVYDSGLFLGSMISTLERSFPYLYVLTEHAPHNIRNTFVLVASRKKVPVQDIIGNYSRGADIWHLNHSEISELKRKAKYIVLNDNFAPVENMLAPVVRRSTTDTLAMKFKEQAEELKKQGKFHESIAAYQKMIQIDPTLSILGYNEIALQMTSLKKTQEAIEYFRKAITYNQNADEKINVAGIHLNLAIMLQKIDPNDAKKEFQLAVNGFKEQLAKDPKSLNTTILLASSLMETGDYVQASVYFQKAIDLNPYEINLHMSLAQLFEKQREFDKAIAVLEKAIAFFKYINEEKRAEPMKEYLDLVKFKKSQSTVPKKD